MWVLFGDPGAHVVANSPKRALAVTRGLDFLSYSTHSDVLSTHLCTGRCLASPLYMLVRVMIPITPFPTTSASQYLRLFLRQKKSYTDVYHSVSSNPARPKPFTSKRPLPDEPLIGERPGMSPSIVVLLSLRSFGHSLTCSTRLAMLALSLATLAAASVARAATYSVTDTFIGSSFLSGFTHEAIADPTHGRVNYVDQSTAVSRNLTFASGNTFIMRADSTTTLNPSGPGRNSVRIQSRKQWSTHVEIMDVRHMPQGCGSWPAYWTTNTVPTLRPSTPPPVALNPTPVTRLGKSPTTTNTNCDWTVNGNAGCGVQAPVANSYGPAFNSVGGGWYAMERTSSYIKVWFWPRNSGAVPSQVRNGASSIDTSTWGRPFALFVNSSCNIASKFGPENIIINLTFCGDWAGGVYGNSGCPGSCVDYVNNNPAAFKNAYWDIAALRTLRAKIKEKDAGTSQMTIVFGATTVFGGHKQTHGPPKIRVNDGGDRGKRIQYSSSPDRRFRISTTDSLLTMADMSPTRRRRSSKDTDSLSQDGTPQPASSAARRNEDDEARRDFLERNKLAARRHRERRKDYIANLERSLHMARQQLEDSRQELDSLRHLATSLAQPTSGPPHPPRAYTSNGYGGSSPPTPVSRPLVHPPAPSQPGEPRIPPGAARARLQALSEVYARAVRSCDDPIPIHCDARFRDLLAGAEDAAAPIRALVLECEELSKTCVDAST
ncbi:glycoside hydrolase family 16 protein, partial [Rhizoctonia solani]